MSVLRECVGGMVEGKLDVIVVEGYKDTSTQELEGNAVETLSFATTMTCRRRSEVISKR